MTTDTNKETTKEGPWLQKMINKNIGSIHKRKLADLVRDSLWTIGTLGILIVAVGFWAPASDWTTAIKWVICVGLAGNGLWSLSALSRTLIMLKEERDY